jgi:EAL domain-containing protein (putative c-di-GMP-specific phosphodiesterase class I)
MGETTAIPSFRALLLEDHDFQRRIGVDMLTACGAAEVLQAADGQSALDIIKASDQPIDLLVCDLNLPRMDGLEVLRHLGERRCTMSVIVASSHDVSILRAAEIMAKSYGIRIIGAVEKPLTRAKLMPMVLRHFSQTLAKPRPPTELMPLDEVASGIDRRQFLAHFQPKIDIRSGTMVGVEALMRWHHPERGLIPPVAFIPVMEAHGLISPATFMMIETALAEANRWREAGLDVPVAINVSVDSLTDTKLPDRLVALTRQAGLTPGCLTIEVTETVAMTDLGHSLETLARCRMKGFELSIDDYGTGFASMQQLTRLPLSELKIDQSFVTGATGTIILEALIETSVAMARRLDLKTVAEGIESIDDWQLVSRLGCDIAQGYFIAKPMPGDQVPRWYAQWLGGRGAS